MTKLQAKALLALIADLYVIVTTPDPIHVPHNGQKQEEPRSATVE